MNRMVASVEPMTVPEPRGTIMAADDGGGIDGEFETVAYRRLINLQLRV